MDARLVRKKSVFIKGLPKHACHRLLGGLRQGFRGPRSAAEDNTLRNLAADFILESLRMDLRHMARMPLLKHGLYTYEAIMSTMHKEKAIAQYNPTSIIVRQGLLNVLHAFVPRLCQGQDLQQVLPYIVVAAFTTRRMGGRAFCERYLSILAKAASTWRRTRTKDTYPPLVQSQCRRSSTSTSRSEPEDPIAASSSSARRLKQDWSPDTLRWAAMRVADELRLEGSEHPVTQAHLPHSAVGNTAVDCSRHWDAVDWRFLHIAAYSIASALFPPASGSGATRPAGLLEDAAHVARHINGFGGTQFCLQIPLCDIVAAATSKSLRYPRDWTDWSPPGPGCRASLFAMRPRWRRERDGEAYDKSLYSHAGSKEAREYEIELATFHEHFVSSKKAELQGLLNMFPDTASWTRRDSQASLCAFSRYLHVRQGLFLQSEALVKCRMYANAPAWPHE